MDIINKIPNNNYWKNLVQINEGYDLCDKYSFDFKNQKFILKVFSMDQMKNKKNEFDILKELEQIDIITPVPIEFSKVDNKYYYILSWVDGLTLKEWSENKSDLEMYEVGIKVGQKIKILHKITKNVDVSFKINRMLSKLKAFETKQIDINHKDITLKYIYDNINKLYQQPISLIHSDLTENNIIVNSNNDIGFIDFGSTGINYSYYDFHQVQMYNRFFNVPFSVGVIDGYLEEKDNNLFWDSFAIYSAYLSLNKIVWAQKYNNEDLVNDMIYRSSQTFRDFKGFALNKPLWYVDYDRHKIKVKKIKC